ncbi:MAG TPA: glycosyl hydrolase [Chitinophagaceae bacterium]|nr:glycosyl hydrolase [Chitinophagaceae bacterium]
MVNRAFLSWFLYLLVTLPGAAQTWRELPADKHASTRTLALYRNLKTSSARGILFGHQDDLAYGVGWKYQPGRSDIRDVTGDYPAVYGWELGRLELDHPVNLDSVPFDRMREFIREAYRRGGVITISWHLNNPLTGKTAWDPAPGTVASVLPGGASHDRYCSWLDRVAAFLHSLRGDHGEPIPVIFRPFHECNGSWFWWGGKNCGADEFIRLYRFTESYLRDQKQVHNLLYAYNTDRFGSREEYLERYPGDEWVDVIGFDIYQRGTDTARFRADLDHSLGILEALAAEKNKLPALTEFGYGGVPDSTWWTGTLLKAIAPHHIAYALAWRNAGSRPDGSSEFYVPYKGQASAADFVLFSRNSRMLFQRAATGMALYRDP